MTDPDSRNVKTPRGYMQGYNAQAVVNEQQIVIAAEVNVDSPDFGHLEPMVTRRRERARARGCQRDARGRRSPTPATGIRSRWSSVVNNGIQVLIPPDAGKRDGTRPGWDGGATRSCAACSRPSSAAGSTENARR